MSRSKWASWEPSRGSVGTAASGGAVRARFEDRTHTEPMRPLPRVSSTKQLLKLMLASAVAIAAAPNVAHAGSVGASPPHQASDRGEQHSARTARRAGDVLALGSGYSNRRDAAVVRALQRRLARLGFSPGAIDGLFGPLTQQAVDRFQTAQRLPVDGIAGPLTLAALRHPSTVLWPGLGYSGRGSPRVRALQRRLVRAGYPPGPPDGLYGPRTERAVARYQASRGLQIDGIAGPRTLGALRHLKTRDRQPRTRRTPSAGARHRPRGGHNGHDRRHETPPRTHRQPRHLPGQVTRAPGRRSTGSSSAGLILLLITLAAAIGLPAIWFTHWRRTAGRTPADRIAQEPAAKPLAPQPEPAEPPTDPERLFQQAVAFDQEGDATRAMQTYAEADRRGHAAAACNLGVLLERHGQIRAASAAFRRADQRGHAVGAFHLGFLLEEDGDLIGAAEAYQRADQRGHPGAASNLGIVLVGRGDATGAMAAFVRGVQRGDDAAAFNLAVLLEEQADRVGAMRMYERAARIGDGEVAERARAAALELRDEIANQAGVLEGDGHAS
jgi:peptidoglycan hydrolase-like protein with peptidoglycan-binding domain/TPR repeat protein